MFHEHRKCRACGNTELVPCLDLGIMPLANSFTTENGEREGYAPLKVLFCPRCTLAQLSVVVKPEVMYKDYAYVTGTSETLRAHFNQLLIDIGIGFKPKHKLLEIGSNNGEFLNYASPQFEVLGIEPAKNLADIANSRGIRTIDRLFGEPTAVELGATGYRADVIVARHVFAHIDDWKGFIHALEFVSHKDTLVVIEVPYVGDMLKMNSFDQIYHEHLSYVSWTAIDKLLEGTKFYIDSAKRYTIHGGAVAFFLKRREVQRSWGTCDIILPEDDLEERWKQLGDDSYSVWNDRRSYPKSFRSMILSLKNLIDIAKQEGKTVCGFGASAKATVWINACGFTRKDIAFVFDNTPQKQGKFIPGTDIPILSESWLDGGNPKPQSDVDYLINFSWNFHVEIAEKHKAFTERGGKWIQVCPCVKIL